MNIDAERDAWFSEHLHYEWLMLKHCLARIQQRQESNFDRNCFLETFVLHARTLYLFLTNDDDSRSFGVKDFVPGFNSKKSDLTKGLFQKIHAQVLHLAKRRPFDAVEKFNSDNCVELYRWLDQELKEFLAMLPVELRNIWTGEPRPATMVIKETDPQSTSQFTTATTVTYGGPPLSK